MSRQGGASSRSGPLGDRPAPLRQTSASIPHAPVRRDFLRSALVAGIGIAVPPCALAEDQPGSEERPTPGDLFVLAEGDNSGKEVTLADLPIGGPPVQAWAMDPATKVVRDGSRLSQVLLIRLEPDTLDEDTQPHAADGVVAYSAICTHAGCPVTGWVEDEGRHVLKCFCHNSEYDPRQRATVVFGPAPRKLAVLPVKLVDSTLVVAGV